MTRTPRALHALTALTAATLIFAATTPGASAAQLIVNGTFETGPNPGSFTTLKGGDTSIPGWTVTGVSVDYIGTYWPGADRGRSIDLDGTPGPGGITQTIGTRPGATYVFAFMLSGNGDCGPDLKRLQASAGAAARTYAVNVNAISVAKARWVRRSFSFRAIAARTRISLRSLDAPTNCGAVVDDVTVTGPPGAAMSSATTP